MTLPQKILIIRLSSIGDIVLTTPIVRCMKQQLPAGTQIHYLTKPAFAGLLANNPYIDGLHTLQPSLIRTLQVLRPLQFDFLLDLHHNQRTWLLKMGLGVRGVSFNKLNWEKWLLTALKIDKMPAVHIVERYMSAAARHLPITNDGQGLDYFIPPADVVNIADQLPPVAGQGNDKPEVSTAPFIAVAIGAAHATKQIPPDKLVELCQKITRPVLLLGGKDDAATGQFVADNAGTHVRSLCGQLSLNGSASVLKQAYKVITPDTGLMHIAAAFDKPIAVVWGNTVPVFGMYPYRCSHWRSFEIKNLPCRPCSKIGHDCCPMKHFNCMKQQSADAIAEWANK